VDAKKFFRTRNLIQLWKNVWRTTDFPRSGWLHKNEGLTPIPQMTWPPFTLEGIITTVKKLGNS